MSKHAPSPGKILPRCASYTIIGTGTSWPSYDQGELEDQIRYGADDKVLKQRYLLASIVRAYREMLELPQKRRNEICKAIREATDPNAQEFDFEHADTCTCFVCRKRHGRTA